MDNIFDSQRRKLALKYNIEIKKHNWYYRLYYILFWIILIYYNFEIILYNFVSNLIKNRELKMIIYIIIFYTLYNFIVWLFDYFLSYRLDKKFNLSNQSSLAWLTDKIKIIILNLLLIIVSGRLIIFLYEFYPEYWWALFAIIGSIFMIIIQYMFPVMIIPIFFKLTSYPENDLKKKLQDLFSRAGLKIEDIYEINLSKKTSSANAAVTGLGKNRKILLADTLEDNYTDGEITAIMAHEIGHNVNRDQFKSIIYQPLILLVTTYIISLIWPYFADWRGYDIYYSIAGLPFLVFFYNIINYILLPFYLLLRRRQEKEADRFAINLIDDPGDLQFALAKLADNNLSEIKLNLYEKLFKASHPGIKERIENIRKYC